MRCVKKRWLYLPRERQAFGKTPELIAFDDTLDLLPVPFTIYERVHGATLGLLDC